MRIPDELTVPPSGPPLSGPPVKVTGAAGKPGWGTTMPNAVQSGSRIGENLRLTGQFSSTEDLIIEGFIEGDIECTATVRIGRRGQVRASINAASLIVEGSVTGKITADSVVDIREGAHVKGDIVCTKLSVADGATILGRVIMELNSARQVRMDERKSAAHGLDDVTDQELDEKAEADIEQGRFTVLEDAGEWAEQMLASVSSSKTRLIHR